MHSSLNCRVKRYFKVLFHGSSAGEPLFWNDRSLHRAFSPHLTFKKCGGRATLVPPFHPSLVHAPADTSRQGGPHNRTTEHEWKKIPLIPREATPTRYKVLPIGKLLVWTLSLTSTRESTSGPGPSQSGHISSRAPPSSSCPLPSS